MQQPQLFPTFMFGYVIQQWSQQLGDIHGWSVLRYLFSIAVREVSGLSSFKNF